LLARILIGAASGITQTKTEQNLRISTLFSDAYFSLMMPASFGCVRGLGRNSLVASS